MTDQLALTFSSGSVAGDPGVDFGWTFSLSSSVTVTALGEYQLSSDGSATIGIWDSLGTLVATATATGADSATDGFNFVSISPVALPSGSYTIGAWLENPPGGPIYYDATGVTTIPELTYTGGAWASGTGFAEPVGDAFGGGLNPAYFGPTFEVSCFLEGTRVRTPGGEMAVEDLAIGDLVVTLSGEARPIRWIGHRGFDGRFVAGNRNVLPISIAAGALADGVPARDLSVSPGHAMVVDGLFLPAHTLVNGITITQADAVKRLEYFHLELDSHDVIFAERAPTETYFDCDNRMQFANAAEFVALHPDASSADWEGYYLPLLERGRRGLPAVRAMLLARAQALGLATDHPDLHLLVDGEVVRADAVEGRTYRFALPAGARTVILASRSAVPMEAEADSSDCRRLGVPFERATLTGAGTRVEIAEDCPLLREGFHGDEGSHHWTDGRALLPPELLTCFAGAVSLEVRIGEIRLLYAAEDVATKTPGIRNDYPRPSRRLPEVPEHAAAEATLQAATGRSGREGIATGTP